MSVNLRVFIGITTRVALAIATTPALAFAQDRGGVAPRVAVDRERGQSVDEFVALALRQSPDGLAARARGEAARGELAQAALRPNPSLSFERRDEIGGMDAQTSIGLAWPLDLFRRDGRVAVARTSVEAADAASADRDRNIAFETRRRVARLLSALKMLQLREDLAASNRKTVELITARAEAGAAPIIDRDVATIEAARSEADVRRQRAEVSQIASELRALAGLGPDAPLVFRDTLEEMAAATDRIVPPDELAADRVQEAVSRRPDVRQADAEEARAKARQDLARREGRADVSLFASYMRMNSGFPQFGLTSSGANEPIAGTFNNVAAGVMVMLPWRNRNQGAIAAAAAEEAAARHERNARRLDALNEIDALRRQEEAARDAVAVFSAGARALAARNVEVQRESYQLGRATLLDVLAETRRYLDFETAYAATLLELVEARVALAAALGGGR